MKRIIKLQGKISPQWKNCLECMREGECSWFEVSGKALQESSYSEPYYLKIEVESIKALVEVPIYIKQEKKQEISEEEAT